MSSIAPVFVVPALATTRNGRRPASASASIAPARSSTRRRNRSSVGSTRIWSGRNPRWRAARASDEWVWSPAYATIRGDIAPTIASRAQAMAVRLAADPPETSTPAAPAGYPIQSRNQSRTVSSSWLGPADSRHAPESMFVAAAIRSPSAAGHVPAPGM